MRRSSSTPYVVSLLAAVARTSIVLAGADVAAVASCPSACFCNAPSQIVYCSRRGLSTIPADVPADSRQLNLNGNAFHSPVMRRANLSTFVLLEHLYLSECRLEVLEVGAFADLVQLRWLDLSNNRLRAVLPDTFSGLQLQHLFINGNRHVRVYTLSNITTVCPVVKVKGYGG